MLCENRWQRLASRIHSQPQLLSYVLLRAHALTNQEGLRGALPVASVTTRETKRPKIMAARNKREILRSPFALTVAYSLRGTVSQRASFAPPTNRSTSRCPRSETSLSRRAKSALEATSSIWTFRMTSPGRRFAPLAAVLSATTVTTGPVVLASRWKRVRSSSFKSAASNPASLIFLNTSSLTFSFLYDVQVSCGNSFTTTGTVRV